MHTRIHILFSIYDYRLHMLSIYSYRGFQIIVSLFFLVQRVFFYGVIIILSVIMRKNWWFVVLSK